MPLNEEQKQRAAEQALEELVRIRQQHVDKLERQVAALLAQADKFKSSLGEPPFPVAGCDVAELPAIPKRRKTGAGTEAGQRSHPPPVAAEEVAKVEKDTSIVPSPALLGKKRSQMDALPLPHQIRGGAAQNGRGGEPPRATSQGPFIVSRREVPFNTTLVVPFSAEARTALLSRQKVASRGVSL